MALLSTLVVIPNTNGAREISWSGIDTPKDQQAYLCPVVGEIHKEIGGMEMKVSFSSRTDHFSKVYYV